MTRDKAVVVNKEGYNKYFLLDGKKMNVQNFNLEDAKVKKGTTGELKRIFWCNEESIDIQSSIK